MTETSPSNSRTTTSSSLFKYVLIPADENLPIQTLQASTAGGLSDDFLVKNAKEYFHELTGAKSRSQQLRNAGPDEKKAIAAQIRRQMSSMNLSDRIENMDDEQVIQTMYLSQQNPTCDIIALTIPTALNSYRAVSMYAAENAVEHGLSQNARATSIMQACGHRLEHGMIHGDVMIGRAHDNEMQDVWTREDFTLEEATPTAPWCAQARLKGGGGGTGGKASPSSLSGLLNQAKSQNIKALNMESGESTGQNLFGYNDAPPVKESWGSWRQTDEEVELLFSVAPDVQSRDCKVTFGRNKVKVMVRNTTLVEGKLFDPIDPDESTFTLDQEGPTGRQLTVSLAKDTNTMWTLSVL